MRIVAALLLVACSHGEPAAAPPAPSPAPRRDFIDRTRPSGGVRAADTANIAAAVNAQYRVGPDRRALLAAADLHELLAGTRVEPELDFAGGKWVVRVNGQQIGTLSELPQFAELFDFLTEYAKSLRVPTMNAAAITEFAAPDAFTAAKAMTKPADAAASLAHAAVAINMQTIDRFGLADRVRSRALALLAIARASNAKELDGDLAILADILGYETEARAMAGKLPANALARAWVLETKPASSDAAAKYVATRNEIRAAVGPERGDAADELAERLPSYALPLLLENPGFGYGGPLAIAAASTIAGDVAGSHLAEDDLRKIVSVFETSLASRAHALASPAFPRDVIAAHYEALFHSALHGIFSSEFDTYASRERTLAMIHDLREPATDNGRQVRDWMQLMVSAKYDRGRGANAQRAVASVPLIGPVMQAKLLRAYSDSIGADDRHVHLALHDLFPRLDSRPAEMLLAGQLSHSILGDVMRRDRYMPVALQRFDPDSPGLDAWYFALISDAKQLRKFVEAADSRPGDRAVALKELSELPGADHAYITAQFEKLLSTAEGHQGSYSTFAAYINERRDWKTKERVVRHWMSIAREDEVTAEAYYASSLAHALEQQGRYDEAWQVVEPHIPVWSANIITAGVSLLERRGQVDEAIDLGRQLLDRYPDAGSRIALATVFWRRGRHAEAAELFDKKHGFGRSGLRTALSRAFIETFPDKENAIAAFKALARGGADPYLVLHTAFDVRKSGKTELSFELFTAAIEALQLDAVSTAGAAFHLEAWESLKQWKGVAAANEWLRPHITKAGILQVGVIAFQSLAHEVILEFAHEGPDEDKTIQLLSLRAASLVHTRAAVDDPRRAAVIAQIRSFGDNPASLLPSAQYLMDLIDEATYLRTPKKDDDRVVAAYFVGLKSAARGDYDKALPWLIYASEGRPDNPARTWAMEMLWRWSRASKPWPEIKRAGLL